MEMTIEEWEHCLVFMDKEGNYPLDNEDKAYAKGCWCNDPDCAKWPYEVIDKIRLWQWLPFILVIVGFWLAVGWSLYLAFH